MNIWTTLAIALGLAMDALAVAIAAGLVIEKLHVRHVFRLAFHFGLFQFLMPLIGWLAGQTMNRWLAQADHWLAFALLGFIGGKMLWESFDKDEEAAAADPTRGWLLVTLSVATSIDALAVGLSLAFVGVSIWLPSAIIGVVACALTALGVIFGARLGSRFGHWAERLGGVILVGIGLQVLLSHLLK